MTTAMRALHSSLTTRHGAARHGWLAGLVLLLAGCGALFGPRSIEVPQARLEQAIANRFPYRTNVLGLLEVTVAVPRLHLLADANRISTDLDLAVSDRLFGHSYRGFITVGHGLRFEPTDATVRLTNLTVDRFVIDGLPAQLQDQLQRIGGLLSEQSLGEKVIYTLRPQDVEAMRAHGQHPGEVRVLPDRLLIALVAD